MGDIARGLLLVAVLALSSVPRTGSTSSALALAAARQAGEAAFMEAECPFLLPGDQEEGREVTCGYLTVPEFHDELDGRKIELLVVTYKSTARQPAAEPLILLLGGPGQEVASVLPAFSESSPINYLPLLERQDVIVLEQRGIGYSRPSLACPFDAVGGQVPEVGVADFSASVETYVACTTRLESDGIDLEAYDTSESAADVNDLRVALGHQQVDLLGVSYGSKLALTVMRDFPKAVRGAVLASPLPLQANVPAGQIIGFDQALKRLFSACAVDPECSDDHPALWRAFSTAVERLDEAPVTLEVRHPLTGDELDLTIDGQGFIGIVYIATFVGLLLPFVPEMIDAAAAGDLGPLELIAPVGAAYGAGVSFGANTVYNCNDELAFTDADEVAALIEDAGVMPELADGEFAATYASFEICDALDLAAPARRDNRPARSEVPALILAGEYDPITPPLYGRQAAETLPNSHLVVLPGLGHDPLTTGGACTLALTAAFLDDPLAAPSTACVDGFGLSFVG